jgi:hypothetical protein
LDEHVEPTKLVANALRRGGDRSLIRHVELQCTRAGPHFFGRSLAALEVPRSDEHG